MELSVHHFVMKIKTCGLFILYFLNLQVIEKTNKHKTATIAELSYSLSFPICKINLLHICPLLRKRLRDEVCDNRPIEFPSSFDKIKIPGIIEK